MPIAGSRLWPIQLSNKIAFCRKYIYKQRALGKKRALRLQVTFAKLLPEYWHGSFQSRDLRNSFAASQAAIVSLRL